MSFTQEKQKNIAICDGCDKKCKLGARAIKNSCGHHHYPTIGGKIIKNFIDANGHKQSAVVIDIYIDTFTTIKKAREIAKLCDHYQKSK